ncbi:hypothetical protein GALMADRAFT_144433 [Galerina marginata CBS 339.88]|uniref:Granulins domain-containing protein n=1 Tax=Galerina marginata (strain CBS 339.88) TaxID=685588 RepID=A0A067SW54_GALM3|nr:hypothetical protein GALMADRAFT_144433 [Galerina marginata CBS 339.88]
MKLSVASLLFSLAFISQGLATPAPAAPQPTCVLHCGGPYNLSCPGGYRCCGPLVVGVGGTCFPGATGICPL